MNNPNDEMTKAFLNILLSQRVCSWCKQECDSAAALVEHIVTHHTPDKPTMFHHETGDPVAKPESLNYRTTDKCDSCNGQKEGTMLHAAGATGRVCPVLFLCDKCHTP